MTATLTNGGGDQCDMEKIWVRATGDVVRGDTIRFKESVFKGSFRKPKFIGEREVVAHIVNDSYGEWKQQHTFTLRILRSSGTQALKENVLTTRKGRNVYRKGTERLPWTNESARDQALDEKHKRGAEARFARAERKAMVGRDARFEAELLEWTPWSEDIKEVNQ